MTRALVRWAAAAVAIACLLAVGIRLGSAVVEHLWPRTPTLLEHYRDVWPGMTVPSGVECVVVVDGYWWADTSMSQVHCLVGLRESRVRSAAVYATNRVVTRLVLSVSDVTAGELELTWGRPSRVWRYRTNLQVSWSQGGWASLRRVGGPSDYSRLAEVRLVIWAWSPPH